MTIDVLRKQPRECECDWMWPHQIHAVRSSMTRIPPPAVIIKALVCWRFLAELLSNSRHTHRLCLCLCLSDCLDACRDCGRQHCQVLNSSTQRLHLSALVSPSLTHLLFSFTYSLTICDIRTPGSIYVWFYFCMLFKRQQFAIVPLGFTVGGLNDSQEKYFWKKKKKKKKCSQNQSYFFSSGMARDQMNYTSHDATWSHL